MQRSQRPRDPLQVGGGADRDTALTCTFSLCVSPSLSLCHLHPPCPQVPRSRLGPSRGIFPFSSPGTPKSVLLLSLWAMQPSFPTRWPVCCRRVPRYCRQFQKPPSRSGPHHHSRHLTGAEPKYPQLYWEHTEGAGKALALGVGRRRPSPGGDREPSLTSSSPSFCPQKNELLL